MIRKLLKLFGYKPRDFVKYFLGGDFPPQTIVENEILYDLIKYEYQGDDTLFGEIRIAYYTRKDN